MKKLISLLDLTSEELIYVLDRADMLEKSWKTNAMPQVLKDKQVGMWFYGQGFRNRVAFEIGAKAMGASVSYIPGDLGVHEPIEDIGHYLDKWFSILIIRSKSHKDLLKLSETTDISIINARTDFSHPCEIIGDLQFIRKHRGGFDELSLVFVGQVDNVIMSWFEAAVRLPISITQVAPIGYELETRTLKEFNKNAVGEVNVSHELEPFLDKADILYTDCWPRATDHEKAKAIRETFLPYQITAKHLSKLHGKALFLPCPPVTRGQEVSHDAMLSGICKNHQAKEYLLHGQNALLEYIVTA